MEDELYNRIAVDLMPTKSFQNFMRFEFVDHCLRLGFGYRCDTYTNILHNFRINTAHATDDHMTKGGIFFKTYQYFLSCFVFLHENTLFFYFYLHELFECFFDLFRHDM